MIEPCKGRLSTSPPGTSPVGFWYPVDCRDAVLLPPPGALRTGGTQSFWLPGTLLTGGTQSLWPPRYPEDRWDSALLAPSYPVD